jgi:hypothetical protein
LAGGCAAERRSARGESVTAVILKRRPWPGRVAYMYRGFRALGHGRWLSINWALRLSSL